MAEAHNNQNADEQQAAGDLNDSVRMKLEELLDIIAEEEGVLPHDDRYEMSLEVEDGLGSLRIAGVIMQSPPDEFISRLQECLSHEELTNLMVDVNDCKYMSSEALTYLVEQMEAKACGKACVMIVKPNEKLFSLIKLIGLSNRILLVESPDQASSILKKLAQLRNK